MVTRRTLILAAAASALARPASAAPSRIIVVATGSRQAEAASGAFARALRTAGVGLGTEASLDVVGGSGGILPPLARMVVAERPTVVVTFGIAALRAMQAATREVPIVSAGVDPVELGLARSYAEPGGNVTGLAVPTSAEEPKRLELMAELLPGTGRLAALVLREAPLLASLTQGLEDSARRTGRDLVILPSGGRIEAEAFATLKAQGVVGMLVTNSPTFSDLSGRLVRLSRQQGLPLVCPWTAVAPDGFGCVLAYGASPRWFWRRLAAITAKVLHGDDPARIPIEMPTEFGFVVNLVAARALGVEVSPMLLARAEEVVD